MVGKYGRRCRIDRYKSNYPCLFFSVADHTAADLIAGNQRGICLRLYRNRYFVGRCPDRSGYDIFVQNRRFLLFFSVIDAIISDRVIHIIDRLCFWFELFCVRNRAFIRLHAPSLEKCKNVLFSRRACQTHQILIRTAVQLYFALRRCLRITGIRIDSCKKQVLKLLFIIRINTPVVFLPAVCQIQLPVHGKLRHHIRRTSDRTGSHFFVYVVI